MIANRRSKDQMNSELSLFLGNHTDKFTDWLHVVLEKLESFAISNNTSDTLKAAVSSIPKAAPPPAMPSARAAENAPVTHSTESSAASGSAMSLASPVKTGYTIGQTGSLYSREQQSVTGLQSAKDDVPYVPMPISQLPRSSVHQPPPDDMEDDCLNIRDDGEHEYQPEEKVSIKRNEKFTSPHASKVIIILNNVLSL